eukprot:CAMPEP_0185773968 /NCGR_PEP_ID=MMETSP1174-20130828/76125_1 /TAXON_ID=35687 /ORGANISM="Dictyocha speculum, Strain CCMP1381" /LENGTH=278 /DNA_ID=CAMNT_0028460919 /DNA_START=26 /DNA_END=858 /DNA_ORIENTATION=-
MGKKKRGGLPQEIPLWIPKRPKVVANGPLTHLNALMQYINKFKLGQCAFKQVKKGTGMQPPLNTWVMRAVIGEGDEMGQGTGESREDAIEKAALVTLHLFDPNGKSLAANISHPDPGQLTKLARDIENVKPEDVAASKQPIVKALMLSHLPPGSAPPAVMIPQAPGMPPLLHAPGAPPRGTPPGLQHPSSASMAGTPGSFGSAMARPSFAPPMMPGMPPGMSPGMGGHPGYPGMPPMGHMPMGHMPPAPRGLPMHPMHTPGMPPPRFAGLPPFPPPPG